MAKFHGEAEPASWFHMESEPNPRPEEFIVIPEPTPPPEKCTKECCEEDSDAGQSSGVPLICSRP